MARIDYDDAARSYDAARGLELAGLDEWRRAVEPQLIGAAGPVLDIGSGTGQWAAAFAKWFRVEVIGVEPSDAMRARAIAKNADPRVRYLTGNAAHLPLADVSCGAAWLSTVIHHITDLQAAAREIRRVLVSGAPVLIRSSFPGRHDGISLFRFFPTASRVAATFPTVEQTVAAFETAGFAFESLRAVPQVSVASLAEFRERVLHQRTADTTMRSISDADFAAGLAKLDRAIAEEPSPRPVVDELDLLVLR